MTRPIEYLHLDDLIALAQDLLGNPPPVRDIGLLGAAAARPQTTVMGTDAYPDLWAKAAALLDSIVNNHSLIDGNKRLGWLATAVFLELNDAPATMVSNDEVYHLVMAVADRHIELEDLATRLQQLCTAP